MGFIKEVLAADPPKTTSVTETQLPGVKLGDQFGFGDIKSLGEGISLLVIPAFTIAGTAVLIYFIIASIKLIFSGGDKAKIQSAKDMITHSIIGVILLIISFFVIPFVLVYFGVTIKLF